MNLNTFLLGALILLGAPLVYRTTRDLFRGKFAADVVASLAIVTAIALNQPFAGLVIVLMQTGGEYLERYAEGKASRAVQELEAAAPRIAHRLLAEGQTEDVAAELVEVGDIILVRPGEMIPCDGRVFEGNSSVDTSRISGEAVPVAVAPGSTVQSGAINIDGPVSLTVTAPASESLYARIVELVRTSQNEKAPIQRLADRWAIWFTPITIAACGVAWWLSGDPLRVLAVLVVATPCPLLIATPVAVIGGINRAARQQIVIRNGTALELLAQVNTGVFDKTGTLTIGHPEVAEVITTRHHQSAGVQTEEESMRDSRELLRLVAGVESGSGHLLARTTVAAALKQGLTPPPSSGVKDHSGRGVSGIVEGSEVVVGSLSLVKEIAPQSVENLNELHPDISAGLRAYVAVNGKARGVIIYEDRIRDGLPQFFDRLKSLGISRTLLLSGDHEANVGPVARAVGISEARGDLLPEDKVEVVKSLEREGLKVLMVGDGTNDAPALSAATVGVALAAHGGGISAEAAGVVLLADDVTRAADAVEIGQQSVRIARQSIFAGLGMSATAMVFAAFGYIPPTMGALIQEGIDIAVILYALRAAVPTRRSVVLNGANSGSSKIVELPRP